MSACHMKPDAERRGRTKLVRAAAGKNRQVAMDSGTTVL